MTLNDQLNPTQNLHHQIGHKIPDHMNSYLNDWIYAAKFLNNGQCDHTFTLIECSAFKMNCDWPLLACINLLIVYYNKFLYLGLGIPGFKGFNTKMVKQNISSYKYTLCIFFIYFVPKTPIQALISNCHLNSKRRYGGGVMGNLRTCICHVCTVGWPLFQGLDLKSDCFRSFWRWQWQAELPYSRYALII